MNPASRFDPASSIGLSSVRGAVVIPTLVSAWYLVRLWRSGQLYGGQLQVFVLWFVVALTTQFAGHSVWMWAAGFLGQVALAIVLVLKHQWDDFI